MEINKPDVTNLENFKLSAKDISNPENPRDLKVYIL